MKKEKDYASFRIIDYGTLLFREQEGEKQ